MIREFAKYYLGTGSPHELLEAIVSYDWSDYEDTLQAIASLKRVFPCAQQPRTLHSNGSSGDSLGQYPFSPDFDFWCPAIERILRGTATQVRLAHGNKDTETSHYLRPVVARRGDDYSVFLDLSSGQNLDQLHDILASIADEEGQAVNLCGKPHSWLLAATDARVREGFLAIRPYVASLVNEDWEPWVHPWLAQEFFFNDQMIDWKTGVNFYTCRLGTRHFLPIFRVRDGRSTNLLNTSMDWVDMSDRWMPLGGPAMCGCGRRYIPFRFQSHAAHNLDIDRSLVQNLRSHYLNLQFLSQDGRMRVLYACNGDFLDEDVIREAVGDVGFMANSQFYIGRKKYNFWKDNRPIEVVPCEKMTSRHIGLL